MGEQQVTYFILFFISYYSVDIFFLIFLYIFIRGNGNNSLYVHYEAKH